jgi:hypothetical protein
MRNYWFLIWKAGIFCPDKEIEGLRGSVFIRSAANFRDSES